jgi:pullulanase
MKKFCMGLGFIIHLFTGKAQQVNFDKYPVYDGEDLGLTFAGSKMIFKIWAPTATDAEITFYKEGTGGTALKRLNMIKQDKGTWYINLVPEPAYTFYTFRTLINGKWSNEIPDPYAKAVGVNGHRAMIIDLAKTNPDHWNQDKSPPFLQATDAVIYELHIRDASISSTSGIKNKGKYLGLTESGTVNPDGLSTGLDHIKELGVTHVQLLPFFDFNSIDETFDLPQYNWGYDPLNYNVPEGSYATNAYDGITRIKELKTLIKTFHENGLRVVMDVVYNHTALTENSNFNQLVPGYYYRHLKDGKFSDATACGNETASERPMFRKFMLESMKYWVKEYHIDGFRVDLMGVHDIETMNMISEELHQIKPDILLYGEGWTAGPSPLPDSLRALKANVSKLDRIAVFSDDLRDGIKGNVFKIEDRGFVSNKPEMEESVKFGIAASCKHPQVDYQKVNYSNKPYAKEPYEVISYCSCHDNHTLWDKLQLSAKNATEEERINMHKLALSVVLTSQGISFLHAGTEMLRSKKGIENSYVSPDSINAIDWNLKTKNKQVFQYVQSLIRMRKEHPAFRMKTAREIEANITFRDNLPDGVISYTLNGKATGDKWDTIQLFFNGSDTEQDIVISKGWGAVILNNRFTEEPGEDLSTIHLKPYTCSLLIKQ